MNTAIVTNVIDQLPAVQTVVNMKATAFKRRRCMNSANSTGQSELERSVSHERQETDKLEFSQKVP